jgi:cysteine desulfurase
MNELSNRNIYVSTGSACNAQIPMPSHVLTACHADLDNYSPIRISLGKYTTKNDIDELIKNLKEIIKR